MLLSLETIFFVCTRMQAPLHTTTTTHTRAKNLYYLLRE